MHTTLIATLAFAAQALAAPSLFQRQQPPQQFSFLISNVPLNVATGADQQTFDAFIGQCFDLPAAVNNTASGIRTSGRTCQLYDQGLCADLTPVIITGDVNDLATIGFDNRLSSIRCF